MDLLTLDPTTVALLDEHRKRQALERQPDWAYWGLMFVKPNGMPYHGADALREFHAACDAAGIARRRFHDLRGSTATLMKDLGVAEDVRMARLGHETRQMAPDRTLQGVAEDAVVEPDRLARPRLAALGSSLTSRAGTIRVIRWPSLIVTRTASRPSLVRVIPPSP